MNVWINERPQDIPAGLDAGTLRDDLYPGAGIIAVNGAPAEPSYPLAEDDRIVFIRRGAPPAQDEFEALLAARHTPGVHARMKRACAGIAGLGGLGSSVAIALARVGVGRLVLADFDVVEPSNLNRQQYFVDQLGQTKVAALSDTLRRVNPYVRVEPHPVRLDSGNVAAIFAGVDVLVEALDIPSAKAMLADAYLAARPDAPLILASGLAGYGPANTIRTRRAGPALWVTGDETSEAAPGVGIMAPRAGIAAHHQALAAMRILLGEKPEA